METKTHNIRMIAPCGINCELCLGHQRLKNSCSGCWGSEDTVRNHCKLCRIKNCEFLTKTDSKFCYECPNYPCTRLKQLEKRYRVRYNVNIFENFRIIKDSGLEEFTRQQKVKYTCPECGGTVCMHRDYCLSCEKAKMPKIKSH